ncbi:hypothetical protein OROHE_027291 [Orobanche hederae]
MSSEDEDGRSMDKGSDNSDVVLMKPKLSYSREFLLSLSNLDPCKKLPSGFDESLKSEFEDALLRIPDRPRIPGSLPFHGFRRNEFGASPPTRVDAGTYSRGNYGKWESRSCMRGDRDRDSQSDKDSDSARCFGHQSRRPWQTSEHDGLLGSGSFPRPSGYAAGVSAPKLGANEHTQPNRSNESYHPPRPYKAVPYSRRDTDAFNDETFGSTECTGEDRAEAERKRRASFEMMRKEQQKVLQEKQKSNLEKHKGGAASDVSEVLADSKEEKGLLGKNNELEVPGGIPILSNDLEKSSFTSHSPASRPLIPPGFKSNTLEKSSGSKFLVHPPLSEVAKTVTGESYVDADANLIPSNNGGLEGRLMKEIRVYDGQPARKTHSALLLNEVENANAHVSLDVPIKISVMEDQLFQVSDHVDPHGHGTLGDNAGVLEDKTGSGSNKYYSTSILEKILGSTLSVDDGPSNFVKHYDSKHEDKWIPNSAESSKFAQWFFEEETKAAADSSSSKPNDLLSLIVSGDKGNGVDQVSINKKEEVIPPILTCEDLEQTILSEYSTKTANVPPVVEGWIASNANSEKSSKNDNNASLHLLSMLKKSTDQNNTTVVDISFPEKPKISQENNSASLFNKPNGEENVETLPNPTTTLTLETLFGTAFMTELQSVEAPVSVQRGPIGSARVDPVTANGSSLTFDKGGLQRPNHDFSASSNHTHHTKVSEAENWPGIDNFPIEEILPKGVEFQLPEEDNLISIGDMRDHRVSTFFPTHNANNNASLSSNTPINIVTDRLAAFRGVVSNERSMEGSEGLPFPFDFYAEMQPANYRNNMQVQQSSPRFQPPQMPHGRPLLYNHLESNPTGMGSQPKFLGPDPIFNHDSHRATNMVRPSFPHPNVRVAGFDVPSQHSMMHQMQIPSNHPPQFPRGFLAARNSNHSSSFVQEMSQVQGFPFGPRQPNIDSRGMPMPGNSPEAFQRLIEMELRANSKQIHPLTPGHHKPIDDPRFRHGFPI